MAAIRSAAVPPTLMVVGAAGVSRSSRHSSPGRTQWRRQAARRRAGREENRWDRTRKKSCQNILFIVSLGGWVRDRRRGSADGGEPGSTANVAGIHLSRLTLERMSWA